MARKKRSDSKKSSPSKKQSRPELILNDKLNELTADELKQFLEFAGSLPRIATETLSSPDMLARHLQARQILGLVDPEENPKLAYEAAKKALQVCDECMEAHMRLGELESNPAKVAEHYRAAAEAGKWMVHAIDTDDISENPHSRGLSRFSNSDVGSSLELRAASGVDRASHGILFVG